MYPDSLARLDYCNDSSDMVLATRMSGLMQHSQAPLEHVTQLPSFHNRVLDVNVCCPLLGFVGGLAKGGDRVSCALEDSIWSHDVASVALAAVND